MNNILKTINYFVESGFVPSDSHLHQHGISNKTTIEFIKNRVRYLLYLKGENKKGYCTFSIEDYFKGKIPTYKEYLILKKKVHKNKNLKLAMFYSMEFVDIWFFDGKEFTNPKLQQALDFMKYFGLERIYPYDQCVSENIITPKEPFEEDDNLFDYFHLFKRSYRKKLYKKVFHERIDKIKTPININNKSLYNYLIKDTLPYKYFHTLSKVVKIAKLNNENVNNIIDLLDKGTVIEEFGKFDFIKEKDLVFYGNIPIMFKAKREDFKNKAIYSQYMMFIMDYNLKNMLS